MAAQKRRSGQPQLLGINLNPKQQIAFDALVGNDDPALGPVWPGVDMLLYGGAAGGGKTRLAAYFAAYYALKYPETKFGLFRRTLPELRSTLQAEIFKLLPAPGFGKYNDDEKTFTLINGSKLVFCYLDSDNDKYRYQGDEFHGMAFDEATHFTFEMFKYIWLTRWRVARPGVPRKLVLCTNPGNIGHNWVKELFIDPAEPMHAFFDEKTKTSRVFVPALVEDNPYLLENDPTYLDRLEAMGGTEAQALRHGLWNIREGTFFTDFNRDRHVVKEVPVEKHWPKWRSIDFGFSPDPLVCQWWTRQPGTRRLFVYRELHLKGVGDRDAKRIITEVSAGDGRIDYTMADTSGKARSSQTGLSTWDVWAAPPHAIPLLPANKKRPDGWRRINTLLQPLDDGLPALQIAASCRNLIASFEDAVVHKFKSDDIAEGPWDDPLDAARYGSWATGTLAADKTPKPIARVKAARGWTRISA